jgi:hypothetical protein
MTPSEIFRSQASVDKFCLLAGMNYGEIELIGSDVTVTPNLTDVQIHSDGTTSFPEFRIDAWHYIDNSMPSSTTDKCGRYFVGPMWNNNSCAADVVFFAALQLNVGISHVEQMGEKGLNKLSIPGLTIRAIVARA